MDPWQEFLAEIEQYDAETQDRLVGEGMRVLAAGMVLAGESGQFECQMRQVGEVLSRTPASSLSEQIAALDVAAEV